MSETLQSFEPRMPAAVRAAGARADELLRQYNTPEPAHAEEPQPLSAEAPPAKGPDPAPAAQHEPAPAPTPSPSLDEWQQRYQTLQGKYNSEVPQLRQQIGDLTQMITAMRQQQLAQSVSPPPPPPAPPPPSQQLGATEKDLSEYGPDLVDAVGRWVAPVVEARAREIQRANEERFNQLSGTLNQTRAMTVEDRVHNYLDNDPQLAGKWRGINADHAFGQWLQEVDPWTGQLRYALLQDAYTKGDGNRTAHFFRAYMAEHTATRPSSAPPPQTPAPPVAEHSALTNYAAPGRPTNGSGGPPPGNAQTSPRIWTRSDIDALYDRSKRGYFRGREAEYKALEADLQAAMMEGRIR